MFKTLNRAPYIFCLAAVATITNPYPFGYTVTRSDRLTIR
jgi:hypothetical protein